MKFFFGFGESGGGYPTGKYPAGLTDLRQRAASYPTQFGSYLIPGDKHMYSQFPDFYQPLAAGIALVDWVKQVLAGAMQNVGPGAQGGS